MACRAAQVLSTRSVWLRQGPSTASARIRLLAPSSPLCIYPKPDTEGELIHVGGEYVAPDGSRSSEWYDVQAGGDRAFVAATFVQLLQQTGTGIGNGTGAWSCPAGQAPLGFVFGVSSLSATIDTDYAHHLGLVGNAALVRAEPSVGAAVLMQLVEGAALRLDGPAEDHQGMRWYPVRLPSLALAEPRGWVLANRLAVPADPCRQWGPAMRQARGATHLWASYTFALAAEHAYPAKAANISVAARNMDGWPIAAGAVAGMNSRWVQLKHGDFYTGWCEMGPCRAGGICGAATTMFRALLKSGLPLVEARSHGNFYDSYNYPGADAMIYAPGKDLRFNNDTGGTLVLVAWSEARDQPAALLTHFALFGSAPKRRQVAVELPALGQGSWPRYDLTWRVTRPAGATAYAGPTDGSLTVTVDDDNVETWRLRTSYSGVGWWENLSRDEQDDLFDLDN